MTPEEKALLERLVKMTEENTVILKNMRTHMRMGTVVKVVYWGVIILLSVGAAYFIQPYIDSVKSLYGGAESSTNTVKSAEDAFSGFHFPGWGSRSAGSADLQGQ